MDRCVPAPWIFSKNGPLVCFRVLRRTIITNIELDLTQAATSFVVWAYVLPAKSSKPSDEVNALSIPYILAGGNPEGGVHTVPCLQQRWELAAGSKVGVLIAPRHVAREAVHHRLASAIAPSKAPSRGGARGSSAGPRPETRPREDAEGVELRGVREVRLAGLNVGLPFFEEEPEWRPLLVRRWFELRSYVREGTVVERPAAASRPLLPGDVKEADAVRADGSWVRWSDGSVGLMDEVKFYFRGYKPARADKVVRVRRYPHRYSDVVGEIPFGLEVHSFGRKKDKFTGEQYALIYLPDDPTYFSYVETYGLISCGNHWIWGWSKIAGASGLPFLVEVDPMCISKAPYMISDEQTQYLPLPKGSIFTSARDNKGVRIRKKPSLKSEKIGQLQPNEVREAIAFLRVEKKHAVPSTSDHYNPNGSSNINKDSEYLEFVEWKDSGFSLIRNAHDTFLTKVELIATAEAILSPSTPFELPKSMMEARDTCNDVSTDSPEKDPKRFRRDESSCFSS
ncbi:unnamed protein product [Phytomonas sp. Hart1]|nr:unnamed protein product [Phytomonas sp. Hart1]|eukprot:CCW71123.1 unnamed protein product [Phytomonas sp. isolate Hart1]